MRGLLSLGAWHRYILARVPVAHALSVGITTEGASWPVALP